MVVMSGVTARRHDYQLCDAVAMDTALLGFRAAMLTFYLSIYISRCLAGWRRGDPVLGEEGRDRKSVGRAERNMQMGTCYISCLSLTFQ